MITNTVRHLFPQLVQNGWVPLPNRDKACMLKGWPSVLVDRQQAALWARQLRWPAIGLRVEPPLLVIDFDLPRMDILAAVVVRAKTIAPGLSKALWRVGNPPKEAAFLRYDGEPFHEIHTRRFKGADGKALQVQAFAGGGGAQQFGAFGPHSHDKDTGAVLVRYAWRGDSPADVPLAMLPALDRAAVFGLIDAADEVLAGWPGLTLDSSVKAGAAQQLAVYDLGDDTVFHEPDGTAYSLDELEAAAKARHQLKEPPMRLTGSFTGDPLSTGSARAKVSWSRTRGLAIVDFKTGLTHRPFARAGVGVEGLSEALDFINRLQRRT